MKPDGMLTTHKMIARAKKRLTKQGSTASLGDLTTLEPVLAEYIDNTSTQIVGKLALAGAPTELVQAVHEDVLKVVLTAIAALSRGHYKLWRETALGKLLAISDPSLANASSQSCPMPNQPASGDPEHGTP